jgi:hypothetical protein
LNARDSIENNLSLYAWAFDMDELELMGDCFTEDAEVTFAVGTRLGRAAVVDQLDQLRERFRPEVVPWHVISNVLITDATEQEATVKSFFTFFTRRGDEAPVVSSIGYYDDVFANEGGTWRVKRRRVASGGTR